MYTWDINILYPVIFLVLFFVFGFYLRKIKKLKKDGIFFVQQFCFWSSVYIMVNINENYSLSYFLNHKESIWVVIFFTITFYAIFLFIPANIFTSKFRNRKLWFYLSYMCGLPSIIIFISWPTIVSVLIFSMLMAFSAACTSQYYLFYSENYQNRIFPFTTISLVFTVMVFATLFSVNIDNFLYEMEKVESVRTNVIPISDFYYSITALIVFVLFLLSLFFLFLIPEKEDNFGYCNIQFEKFEPFIWVKGILLFVFLFVIVLIEEIGHGLFFNWMLDQNVWTTNHNDSIVSLYSRLSIEIYDVTQILISGFIGFFIIKRLGIKYTFGLGLFLKFLYFSLMSFSSNPVLLLFLDFISGAGYVILIITLFTLALMWQTRTPNKKILPIFITIFTFTSFFTQYIIKLLSGTTWGIFKLKNIQDNYVPNDEITIQLNAETTIIFTILAVITLGLLILFYYCSEFILAEYNNDIYFLNKMNEIKAKRHRN